VKEIFGGERSVFLSSFFIIFDFRTVW
jgi:hypothetical protein